MKKLILSAFFFTFLIACEKKTDLSYNLASVEGWITISFKSDYTIQIPDGFEGIGMAGFEGNTFSKYSADNTIYLSYAYCNGLFCYDFGDALGNSVPESVEVKNNSGALISLNKKEYFYKDSEVEGILYYSDDKISRGRLFWNDSGSLKAALEIDFNLSDIEDVSKIIGSIKAK
jgi:hypothetical protein